MKFIYISKTLEAPLQTTILGYRFALDGNAVEVENKIIQDKLLKMEHIGIIPLDKIDKIQIIKDEPKNKKKPFKDCFLELTPNATRTHINNVVNSKTSDQLKEYIKHFAISLSKEDAEKIKKPELAKSTLIKYVKDSLTERLKGEVKEETKEEKIKKLINSKTYNEMQAFAKEKELNLVDSKKETLIKAITEYLNGTN